MIQTVFYVLALFSSGLTSYIVVARTMPSATRALRYAVTIVLHVWLLIVVFHFLALFSVFLLPVAIPLVLVLTTVVFLSWGKDPIVRQLLAHDSQATGESVRAILRSRWSLLAIPVVALLAALVLRAMVAPPLAWDSLTYHLVKPARWVQYGGYAPLYAPDATMYYQYFQSGGEVLWAWAMLAAGGDQLLGLSAAHAVVVSAGLLYGAGRILGASRTNAFLFVLAVLSLPSVLLYVGSMYVDTLHMAFLLFGIAACVHGIRRSDTPLMLASLAAIGVAAAIKVSSVPYAALVVGAVLLTVVRSLDRRRFVVFSIWAVAALLVALPDYARAWMDMGSPTYPLEVTLGPFGTLAGNEELRDLFAGDLNPHVPRLSFYGILSYLFVFTLQGWNHLNFGFGGALLVLGGILGLIRGLVAREHRAIAGSLIVVALVGIAPFVGSTTALFRQETWAPVYGRLFLVPMTAMTLIAVLFGGVYIRYLMIPVILLNVLQSLPAGWGSPDGMALSSLLPWALVTTILGMVGIYVATVKRRVWAGLLVCVAALVLLTGSLSSIRSEARYVYYKAASFGSESVFDVHQLEPYFASSWKNWKFLDQAQPLHLAVAAGWDGIGHNWYWYPFLGSRLQNHLHYVPITRTGAIMDYRSKAAVDSLASREVWLRGLLSRRIDYLVTLVPSPIEGQWAQEMEGPFELVSVSDDGENRVYRVHPDRIERTIANE